MKYHIPVLLKEILDNLVVNKQGTYVDATLGGGGHTAEVLCLLDGGNVIGIDRDANALQFVKDNLKSDNLKTIKANFASLDVVLYLEKLEGVDGILADLGVSSEQIDNVDRGFSYMKDGPLDMRMDNSSDKNASDVLNTYSEWDLADIIYKYGEEHRSRQIAAEICKVRKRNPFKNTSDLKNVVDRVVRGSSLGAFKRVFQAIRIEVNQELKSLETFLEKAKNALKPGGRLAIISFHSLEDRIVKNFFQQHMNQIHKKAIKPSWEEMKKNRRAKSAKLRVAEIIC